MVKSGKSVEVQVEAVDRAQRRLSLALAEIRRAEEEEAATMTDYKQKVTEDPQNMGKLGDMLKPKMEQKEK